MFLNLPRINMNLKEFQLYKHLQSQTIYPTTAYAPHNLAIFVCVYTHPIPWSAIIFKENLISFLWESFNGKLLEIILMRVLI